MTARDRARAAGKRWAVRVGALPPDHRYTEGDMPDAIADEFAADVKLADKWREVAARFSAKLIFALDDPASLMGQRIVLASEKADDSRLAELARECARRHDDWDAAMPGDKAEKAWGRRHDSIKTLVAEARRQLAAAAEPLSPRCSCGEFLERPHEKHRPDGCSVTYRDGNGHPIPAGSRRPR